MLFLISVISVHITHGVGGLDTETAISFLIADMGMLVTVLTVTMAMTMLEIQFRAQSYTMLSIIQHVRDGVIYGFVLVSMSMIIFISMPLVFPNIVDPLYAAPYAVVGTVFTLIYLTGYVYYMIGKAQPEKVIKDIIDEVMTIEPDDIIKHASEEKKIKIFHVWEHLMLRAVKTDDTYAFKAGIGPLMSTAHSNITKCNGKEKDMVGRMFFQHLHPVVLASVRSDKDRFIRLFMDNMYKYSEKIPKETSEYSTRRLMMFHLWQHVMREALDRNNVRIIKYGMRVMYKIMNKYNGDDKLYACAFIHRSLHKLVIHSFTVKSSEFLNLYLDEWNIYYNLLKDNNIKYKYDPLSIWENIMMKTATDGDCWTYGYGAFKMSEIIKADDYKLCASLHKVVDHAICTNYSFICIMSLLDEMDYIPLTVWQKIARYGAESGNMFILEACMIKEKLSSSPYSHFILDYQPQ